MPTIIHRLRDAALEILELEDIAHGPDDLGARIISDANRALQTVGGAVIDDTFHFEEERGSYINPLTTFTANVTQGEFSLASPAGNAAWMNGCTCQLPGDNNYNRLRINAAGALELSQPRMGPTATGVIVSVWGDCVRMATDVLRVKGPVIYTRANTQIEITPIDMRNLRRNNIGTTRIAGDPLHYAEQSLHAGDTDAPSLALMFEVLPMGASTVTYTAVGKLPNFTTLDDARQQVIPFDITDSVLVPVFRYFFVSYSNSQVSKQDLTNEYEQAMRVLARIPKRNAPRRKLRQPPR